MACPVGGVLAQPGIPSGPLSPSADATATSRDPAASAAWIPPLILVARSLAMEWPPLGLDLRELEMALN
jgi:hypothetical protein